MLFRNQMTLECRVLSMTVKLLRAQQFVSLISFWFWNQTYLEYMYMYITRYLGNI